MKLFEKIANVLRGRKQLLARIKHLEQKVANTISMEELDERILSEEMHNEYLEAECLSLLVQLRRHVPEKDIERVGFTADKEIVGGALNIKPYGLRVYAAKLEEKP